MSCPGTKKISYVYSRRLKMDSTVIDSIPFILFFTVEFCDYVVCNKLYSIVSVILAVYTLRFDLLTC